MTTLTTIVGERRQDDVAVRDEGVKLLVREVMVDADHIRELVGDVDGPHPNEEQLEGRCYAAVVRYEGTAPFERVIAPCFRIL